jgi:hypothetical protein
MAARLRLEALEKDRLDLEECSHKSADGPQTLQTGAENNLMPLPGIRRGMLEMPYSGHSARHKSFPFFSVCGSERKRGAS